MESKTGIDVHCHLETMDNFNDVIIKCQAAGMKALISVATQPGHFEKGLEISSAHKNFVFLGAGVHPEFVKKIKTEEIEKAFSWLRDNEKYIVGIGEQGLDYYWIKEAGWREKQKELFERSITLSKELDKPLIVHTRDAHEDVMKILMSNRAENVQLHMWGENKFTKEIADRGWFVSVGPIIANSKKHKKVVRNMPIESLMLETDSPWFGPKSKDGRLLGEPTNISVPAGKIAEIKEMNIGDVLKITSKNAARLFRLPLSI